MIVAAANILSFIADCFLVVGASRKTKKETLKFQCIFLLIVNLSNILLKAWSGFVIDAVSLVRNFFVINKKNTKTVNIILFILAVALSLLVCESAWGLFPVAACIVENYFILKPNDDIRVVKLALAFSCACWVVYCLIIHNYVGSIFNLISCVTYLSYFFHKKTQIQ